MKSIPLNTSRYTGYLLSLGILFCSQVVGAERCEPQDNNEYEKIFCQLKRSGKGADLPNIYQFRANTPLTQALLLKKPAARAGIIVKIPERDNQDTLQRQDELLTVDTAEKNQGPRPLDRTVKTVSIVQQAPSVAAPPKAPDLTDKPAAIEKLANAEQKKKTAPVTVEKVAAEKIQTDSALNGCTFQQLVIQCARARYQFVGNKNNQQLPDNALADDHKLGLPVYRGATDDGVAVDEYLKNAYSRYLTAMMEIGLGASTMSYGKFANLYKYITDQHLDFVARFETMYQFLKKDKQTICVSTKLNIADGFVLENCNVLENIVACDYQKTNYLFVKAGMSDTK